MINELVKALPKADYDRLMLAFESGEPAITEINGYYIGVNLINASVASEVKGVWCCWSATTDDERSNYVTE